MKIVLLKNKLAEKETKEDVLKDKKNYRKPTKEVEQIYDYNWLEEE